MQRTVTACDYRSAFVAASPLPGSDHPARGFDNRNQRLDVVSLQRRFDDDVDQAHREQAIRIAIAAPARQASFAGDAAERGTISRIAKYRRVGRCEHGGIERATS